MSQPSPESQVQFLLHVQRLLDEGVFTATYKYALLLALADLAVEFGDDSGESLTMPIPAIAEKYIAYYWRQVVPYVPPSARAGVILQQNTDRQAAIVSLVAEARTACPSLADLRHDARAWRRLVSRVSSYFWTQPLWRLQRIGDEVLDFLYENRELGTHVDAIELRPGAAFNLRRFHALITQLVRGAWLAYIRKFNSQHLGVTADLEEFLFGTERADLSGIRPALVKIQGSSCFYCGRSLGSAGDVDHFVPWARYPVDLGHNFVLAHSGCNSAKGALLAAEPHLARWAERNRDAGLALGEACDGARMLHNLEASEQIAFWAYEQAAAVGGRLWLASKHLVPITAEWRRVLG
jgi:hypothetical protein